MQPKLKDALFKAYPDLYDQPKLYDFSPPDGWYQLLVDLSEQVKDLPLVPVQVKSKFGGLRFYYDFKPGSTDAEESRIVDLVEHAEGLSHSVCETCGKPGTSRCTSGYYATLCPDC